MGLRRDNRERNRTLRKRKHVADASPRRDNQEKRGRPAAEQLAPFLVRSTATTGGKRGRRPAEQLAPFLVRSTATTKRRKDVRIDARYRQAPGRRRPGRATEKRDPTWPCPGM